MQTANMDSCSLRLDYEVSSDSCTYLVFSVKTLLKQFPFRPIPGKLPPPVWWEWLPRKSLGPLKNAFKKKWYFLISCTIWCEVLHRRRISGTILMAIEVAPREALRNGTVLCREVEDFVGNVSDKAPRHLDQNAWKTLGIWFSICTKVHTTDCFGNDLQRWEMKGVWLQ